VVKSGLFSGPSSFEFSFPASAEHDRIEMILFVVSTRNWEQVQHYKSSHLTYKLEIAKMVRMQ